MTYRPRSVKTKDLWWCDLDAKWTPERARRRFGLHTDSKKDRRRIVPNGQTWSSGQPINGVDSSSDSVAVCVFNNQLFVFWKANDSSNRIIVSASGTGIPGSWPAGQVINGRDSTSAAPAAAVFNNQLFVFWKANDPSNRIFFSQSVTRVSNS